MENVNTPNQPRTTVHNSPRRPLLWVAAIAVILFSVVGIAAFMGWIPSSTAQPDNRTGDRSAVTGKPSSTASKPTKPAAVAVVTPKCLECGEIASVREVVTKAKGSGFGAVGGAVVGGVLGNQVGEGQGKDVATVAGAIGGAVAGNEIEKRTRATKSYEITVRLDNGSTRVITEPNLPSWRTGDRVKIVDGEIRSNS